jgi:peptidyl-prolyl cis-trans isomerase B (cyclophilin B)
VASTKERQRKLARAKLDRQMARRAQRERRRRRILAGVGAGVALLVIVGGIAWLAGAFDTKEKAKTSDEAADICTWTPQSAETNTDLKDVGTPPTKGIPTAGTRSMTITTNRGAPIVVSLDLAKAPCSGADLTYLAGKKFYDNTDCTEITSYGAVRCGDPAGTGLGGPAYSFYNENVPTGTKPAYPTGTVALIGNPPGTNGSQFLIFFKDYNPATAQYPIVGRVTSGMETVAAIGKIPTADNGSGSKVKPKQKITIKTLTVGDVATGAAPSASAQS